MLEWLFGRRKDTAESLTREVNSFFDRFRRLQTRIQALVATNKQAELDELGLFDDTLREIKTTFDEAVDRATTVHDQDTVDEGQRHDEIMETLSVDMASLRGSLRLATKVVKFAEEE